MSLEGRLEDLGLPDIFQILNLSRRSGVLTLIKKDGMGRVVFNQGNVVYASSDGKSRFGYTLLQKNLITRRDLERALTFQKARSSKKPIGTILVEMGSIAQSELEAQLKLHIVDVVRDLLTWNTGSFHFTLAVFPEEGILMRAGVNAEFLLLEGARLDDEADQYVETGPGIAEADDSSPPVIDETTPLDPSRIEGDRDEASEAFAGIASDDGSADRRESGPGRKDLALLPMMIEELSGPVSAHDVTLMMLRFAGELMNRAVLFLVRDDAAVGWGQFGVVVETGSADERVRSLVIPLSEASSCREVVGTRQAVKGTWADTEWNRYLIEQLGGDWPVESFLAPVVCHDRVTALLYGDNLPGRQPIGETGGLEAFIRVAGVTLSTTPFTQRLDRNGTGGP